MENLNMNTLTKQHTDFMVGMTPLKAINFLSILNNTQTNNSLTVGDLYQGGYFAGYIVVNSIKYALIVAPKATGESNKQWKTTADITPGTQSVNDGWANTNVMNNSSHPAAQWTRSLNIGGFTDWYLPAKAELEICYRAFKPDTTANIIGDLGFGFHNGYNSNSSPVGYAYTDSVPDQTSITAFRTGSVEAFKSKWYWTSTENGSTTSQIQSFSNGHEGSYFKTDRNWVRAVRRVPV